MKSFRHILTCVRKKYNQFVEKSIKRSEIVIPYILLIAFIFTFADFSFLKQYVSSPKEIINYVGENNDISTIANDYEVVELRTANTKTYKKVNNSYELVVFGNDVHYEKDEKFIEIDNTLINKSDYYENKANKFSLQLPTDIRGKSIITAICITP
jgi:hypothetical protein